MCVEVKDENDNLRHEQVMNHAVLTAAGLPVHILRSPDVSQIGKTDYLSVFSEAAHQTCVRKTDEFLKMLENTKSRFNRQRENTLADFDCRMAEHTKTMDLFISQFQEIANLLKAAVPPGK
jgi:hypothetical protein